MKGRFLFLGTGGSSGVPMVGCKCPVCKSTSPYNRRLRPSAFIHIDNKVFLIDAGPDFREQALNYGIDHLDGVLLTHSHYDHIGGMDDLRPFYFFEKRRLPCLLSKETFDELAIRYHYMIRKGDELTLKSPQIDFHLLEKDFSEVEFEGIRFQTITYFQGKMKVTGYRLGDLAYISDIHRYTDEVLAALKGVKTLVLSALRFTQSDEHFSIDQAVAFAKKVGADKTYLMHVSHDLDYEKTNAVLPDDVRLSYDGLEIDFAY